MRPMARSDKDKGFLEVLRGTGKVGYVSNKRWDERCEYLYKRAEQGDEYILVIVDVAGDRVVGVGRWVSERGLCVRMHRVVSRLIGSSMNNLATNGRVEDIAVAKDLKGMKLGLRILEALVHVSVEAGCHKVRTHQRRQRGT
jgi:glucosamine-phosphate N-acetyltransferase